MGSHTHQPEMRTAEPKEQHENASLRTSQSPQHPAALAAAVGNQQFQGLVAAGSLRPQGPATPPRPGMSPAEVAQAALQQRQPRMLLSLNGDFAGIDDARRAALIDLALEAPFSGRGQLLHQLWSGWPGTAERVVAGDPLWARSVKAVPALTGAPLDELRQRFIADVRARARQHLETGRARAEDEGGQLARPHQREERLRQIRRGATRAHQLLELRRALLATPVGWIRPIGATGVMSQATFNPTRPPANPYGPPRPTWDALKVEYDWIVSELPAAAAVSPVVAAAISAGDVRALIAESDRDVTDESWRVLSDLLDNHAKARAALADGSLNWFDLVPVHDQLLTGETAASGTNWGTESLRGSVGAILERHDREQWMTSLTTGLGVAVAATVVSVLSGGVVVPLLAGGAATGYGGRQTYRSWQRAGAMEVAHAANAGQVTELITADAAAEARFEARLNLALSVIDSYGLAKGTRNAVRALPRSGAAGQTPAAATPPPPARTVARPVEPTREHPDPAPGPSAAPSPLRAAEPSAEPDARTLSHEGSGSSSGPPVRATPLDDVGLSLWKYARDWVDRSSATRGRWRTMTGNRRFADTILEIPTQASVIRVAIRLNPRRLAGQNADTARVASSDSRLTRGPGPGHDWEATIDVPLVGNPDEMRYALGREFDTITGAVLKDAPDATATEKVPGLFERQAAGTPTSRDIALVRELVDRLSDLRATENTLRDGGAAGVLRTLAERTMIQRQEIAKLTREMGFDDPRNLSAKLEALGTGPGSDAWVYLRDELVQRGLAPMLRHVRSLPGVDGTLSDTLIADLYRVTPSDPKGSFVRDGLSGGRVERELRAFVQVRQDFALVEVGNRTAGGTTYRLYEQYRWVGDGPPPRSGTREYPKPTGPVPPGWEKSERAIASVSDLDAHLIELAAAIRTSPMRPSHTVTLTTETGVPVKIDSNAAGTPTAVEIDPRWFR